MENHKAKAACTLAFLATMYVFPEAGRAGDFDQWRYEQLMQPSAAQLAREADGRVEIYDGMREQDVELAMDSHFARIDAMMFVRTFSIDASGEASHSDDCD